MMYFPLVSVAAAFTGSIRKVTITCVLLNRKGIQLQRPYFAHIRAENEGDFLPKLSFTHVGVKLLIWNYDFYYILILLLLFFFTLYALLSHQKGITVYVCDYKRQTDTQNQASSALFKTGVYRKHGSNAMF